MPNELPKHAIEDAASAITFAQQVRKHHGRRGRRASKQRVTDIELALARIKEAMKPLRTEIGRFPYGPQTTIAENNRQAIRDASEMLQKERRKLWKMKNAKITKETTA